MHFQVQLKFSLKYQENTKNFGQIAAYYSKGKIMVGGHPDGVKFLLSNMRQYGIKGFIKKLNWL